MKKWAAILPQSAIGALAPHRLDDLEALEQGGEWWVRGTGDIPRAVPWRAIFELHDEGVLRLPGHLLTAGRLPAGPWQKLAAWLRIERPVSLREGLPPGRAPLRLVPATQTQPVALLATSLENWLAFAIHAPEVRLRPLRFAQTETGRVFVAGQPLPSLPAEYFTLHEQIATPAGHTWEPALAAASLGAALGLVEREIAVLLPEGTCLRLPGRAWQPASRAAARVFAQASRDAY